jgi:Tol biopolymer transport system component
MSLTADLGTDTVSRGEEIVLTATLVRVDDQTGTVQGPAVAEPMSFVITKGDDSLSVESVVSNDQGLAVTHWIIGREAGEHSVELRGVDSAGTHVVYDSLSVVVLPRTASLLFEHVSNGVPSVYSLESPSGNPILEGEGFHQPALAPDKRHLAIITDGQRDDALLLTTLDGGDTVNVTLGAAVPEWSHDGGRVAFQMGREIFIVNADGTGLHQVTSTGSEADFPSWMHGDSALLLNVRSSQTDRHLIYRLSLQTDSLVVVSRDSSRDDIQPVTRAGGDKIAFVSVENGNYDIYVMSADGSDVVRLTREASMEIDPAWSPDGSQIVFSSDRGGDLGLYVMNADGSDVQPLVDMAGFDAGPSWQ